MVVFAFLAFAALIAWRYQDKILALRVRRDRLGYALEVAIVRVSGHPVPHSLSLREAIENLEALIVRRGDLSSEIDTESKALVKCENKIVALYKERGSLEQKLSDTKEQEEELKTYRQQYASSDLFQQCMHSNGISLDIIKNKLPVLNEEIASVLANIVNFDVYLQCVTKHLEIFIKHPKYEARPLVMGSGAEKTIASMAIRLALLNVSSMPKGDTFILD